MTSKENQEEDEFIKGPLATAGAGHALAGTP